VEGVNSSIISLIHCNKLCKCYNVPPPSTIKKKWGRNGALSIQKFVNPLNLKFISVLQIFYVAKQSKNLRIY
jgi:hypothetical protein